VYADVNDSTPGMATVEYHLVQVTGVYEKRPRIQELLSRSVL
jgi:hypothetical protein